MDAYPPTTTPDLCTQYKVYWRECGHEYSNVGGVVPCQAAANNLQCACRTNLRILRTTTSRGVDGHTRVLSDGTETGFCRPCRLSNERERKKEIKKKKKVGKADKGKKVDGGSKVSGTGGESRSGFGGVLERERNVRVEKKYVKVDGGGSGSGSKDDWEVGMPPKTIKQYQTDLKMLKESIGTGTGKTMSL